MSNELTLPEVPISTELRCSPAVPELPALPKVGPLDLYAALLADAQRPATRTARQRDVGDFARFVGTGPEGACALLIAGGMGQANALVLAYQRGQADRGLASATIARRLCTLVRVVKLGRRFELVTWALELDAPTVQPYRDTRGPGKAGWLRALDYAQRQAQRTALGKRDLAVLLLLHDQGLRRSSVAALDHADFEPDSGRLRVTAKRRSDKEPHTLNDRVIVALSRWVDVRGDAPGPLFVRMDNCKGVDAQRLSDRGIYELVVALGRRAGVKGRLRPHGLRHQAITQLLEITNGDLVIAQQFAGHASPATTIKYNDNLKDYKGKGAKLLGES